MILCSRTLLVHLADIKRRIEVADVLRHRIRLGSNVNSAEVAPLLSELFTNEVNARLVRVPLEKYILSRQIQ